MRPRTSEAGTLGREIAETRFVRLYAEHGRKVLAFALRRVSPDDAADVVAETFLVAWRRAPEIPPDGEVELWLYGVARRVLANQERGARRRTRLNERLRAELPAVAAPLSPPVSERPLVLDALARLDEEDREVLLLTAWEDLRPAQVAKVLRISAVAARSRLHRARRRLRKELSAVEECPDDNPTGRLELEEAR
jgi:RNA polymerase sigma-70 factor (ECF subfamily)